MRILLTSCKNMQESKAVVVSSSSRCRLEKIELREALRGALPKQSVERAVALSAKLMVSASA